MQDQLRVYTEQYMLAAFLHGNNDWQVIFHNGHLEDSESYALQLMSEEEAESYSSVCSFNTKMLEASGMPPPASIYLKKLK